MIFAADRWLLGPEGVAVIWTDPGATPPQDMALPRTALIGLARSVGWLEMYVSLEWIYERTAGLARRLRDGLANVPGVQVLTPADAMAAVVCFRIENWPADAAAEELSRRVHSLVRPAPDTAAIRASVAWFNTEEEIDQFGAGVAELAANTPATLPRRPTLIVLGEA